MLTSTYHNTPLHHDDAQGEVEDWTGRGLADLRAGICRTPLPPRETFLDDPLRVLRAVRFASRFDFRLDDDLSAAAASREVVEALSTKVSRERFGVEVGSMISGPRPASALDWLNQLGLLPTLLAPPIGVTLPAEEKWEGRGVACADAALRTLALVGSGDDGAWASGLDADSRRVFALAALGLPLRHVQGTAGGKKGKSQPLWSRVVQDSLKMRGKDATDAHVVGVQAEALARIGLVGRGADGVVGEDLREAAGVALKAAGAHWKLALVLAPVTEMVDARPVGSEPTSDAGPTMTWADLDEQARDAAAATAADTARALIAAVEGLGLAGCHEWTPLLGGKEVAEALGVEGPALGEAMNRVTRYRFRNATATPSEALAFLKGSR